MVDKNLSMSQFLALRYTEKQGVDFTEKLTYRRPKLPDEQDRIFVRTAEEIGDTVEKQLAKVRGGLQDGYPAFRRYGFGDSGLIPAGM